MIRLAKFVETRMLPLPIRRQMYERIVADLERKGKVVGRVTKKNLREYYRLPDEQTTDFK